jgi:hypothetical protein
VEESSKRSSENPASSIDGNDTQAVSVDEAALVIHDQLLRAPIITLRRAVQAISPVQEPEAWADAQFSLGWALRLRGRHMSDRERTRVYVEAITALEAALVVFSEPLRSRGARDPAYARHDPEKDGTHEKALDLIVACTRGLMSMDVDMLREAVRLLRENLGTVNRRNDFQGWLLTASNLACGLTLLSKTAAGVDDPSLLDEAVDLLREILWQPKIRELTEQYVFVHINLADAFYTLAERAMPVERLRCLESTLHSLAQALGAVCPEKYGALIELHGVAHT